MWYANFRAAASVSPPTNAKPTSVVSIVVPSYQLMNPYTVCVAPSRMANPSRLLLQNHQCYPRLDLVQFLRQLLHNTGKRTLYNPEHKYQMNVFQLRKQSVPLCWDILKHDVPLVDTTCTDHDEDEERNVVHRELYQPESDASWTSVDDTRHVSSAFLTECQVYPNLSVFHLSENRIFLSSNPSCLCHETLQCFRQWMAEPSHQKHQ